jgi:hypothetical protein
VGCSTCRCYRKSRVGTKIVFFKIFFWKIVLALIFSAKCLMRVRIRTSLKKLIKEVF